MEGGAHVILEAVQSGTAVLASRIDGNVGMLGPAHEGYFEVGDDAGLAAADRAGSLTTRRSWRGCARRASNARRCSHRPSNDSGCID